MNGILRSDCLTVNHLTEATSKNQHNSALGSETGNDVITREQTIPWESFYN